MSSNHNQSARTTYNHTIKTEKLQKVAASGRPQTVQFTDQIQAAKQNKVDDEYYVNKTCSDYNSGFPQKQQKPHLGTQHIPLEPVFGDKNIKKEVPVFGGNWSRSKYDTGSLTVDTRQSTAPLEWLLDPTFAERCMQCRPPDSGWIGKQGVSYDTTRPLIDTESELFNLNRILTRDPNYNYVPYCPKCGNCTDGAPCGQGVTSAGCDNCQPKLFHFAPCGIKNEYTRISNPQCTLKETGVNRFNPICLNPQDETRWLAQGEVGISYRLVAKDNHVACVPYPVDPVSAMPRGGDIACNLVVPTCSAYTSPMNNYRLMEEGPLFVGVPPQS